jgi:hypothetical protein
VHIGYHQCTLQRFTKLSDVYIHENAASPAEIDEVLRVFGSDLDAGFESVYQDHVSGKGSLDANYAFAPENRRYAERERFNRDFGLKDGRTNVFVMLHAFNDFPHSHFRWMLFRDYYDWMMQTLAFARACDNVQWIFKQHPSVRMYPTKDTSLREIFQNLPAHIAYIDENHQIDTRSLIDCADVVITCLGSAGFELPGMAGIPSVIASDAFYIGLGFAVEPKTRREYFDVLGRLNTLGRLTPEQRHRARAAYMFIYRISARPMAACPRLSFEDQRNPEAQTRYWDMVAPLYTTKREEILRNVRDFIGEVSASSFQRTTMLKEFHQSFISKR